MTYVPRLLEKYRSDVVEQLRKEFSYKNVMQVPTLAKVTLNMGLGEAIQTASILESGVEELTAISGQKPVVTKARMSIANFKLRAGMSIGAMVTLRRVRMWEFIDRLVSVAIPRVRDFRGLSSKSFDGRGNYSLGIREQVIFPEIDVEKVDRSRGLGVVVNTTAKTDEEGRALLRHLGFPFRTD
ncbi:MAG: 50S ribosomal protein L5 [bacterium]|nr:50S ribosomal protein L5 [bacterium]